MSQAESVTRAGSHAPLGEDARIAMIRSAIRDDPETCAAFAEDTRRRVTELTTRADAVEGLSAARDRLDRLIQAITGLDVRQLEPRRGLAGVFDSRSRRLKAFREAFGTTTSSATEIGTWLSDQAQATTARHDALDAVWNSIREGIADLDDHIAVGRAWLADQVAAPSSGTDPTATSEPTESPTDTPHPMEMRLVELAALRTMALNHLPRLRAQQNAEHRVPAALKTIADAVAVWHSEWRDALGLSGTRPRKVRPDAARLDGSRDALKQDIEAAQMQLDMALDRWSELEQRRVATHRDEA